MRSKREKEKKIELRHGEEWRDLRLGRFRQKKGKKILDLFFLQLIYIYMEKEKNFKNENHNLDD